MPSRHSQVRYVVNAKSKLIGVSFDAEWKPFNSRSVALPVISRLFCSLESKCPVLERGKCIHVRILGCGCVFGKIEQQKGPSIRAKGYRKFCQEANSIVEAGPNMPRSGGGDVMAILGEYVYLPYSHMDMNKDVPFVRHSEFMVRGVPFMKLAELTPEIVASIAAFRPQALFGGEIVAYQRRSVPLFLFHLRSQLPELYAAAVAVDPKVVERTLNIESVTGLETTLDKVPVGCSEGYTVGQNDAQPVSWDGTVLKIKGSGKALSLFFPGFEGSGYELSFTPDTKKTKVKISGKDLIAIILEEHPEILDK